MTLQVIGVPLGYILIWVTLSQLTGPKRQLCRQESEPSANLAQIGDVN